MIGHEGIPTIGNVSVMTSNNGGHSVEEVTELLLRRIISVADTAPPAIRAQAVQFQDSLRSLIRHYMAEAVRSDRATLAGKLRREAPDVADLIINL
jgi:hypothetical protein